MDEGVSVARAAESIVISMESTPTPESVIFDDSDSDSDSGADSGSF